MTEAFDADTPSGSSEAEVRSAPERILASAVQLFAERGFDRTSTARIATAANVPHGLIFYYFKTKIDLLLAVTARQEAVVLDDLIPPWSEGDDITEAISELWRRLSTALGKQSAVSQIIFHELDSHPEVRQRATEAHEHVVAAISGYLETVCGHVGEGRPDFDTAARLLGIAAAISPMLGEPGRSALPPDRVGTLIANALTTKSHVP